MALVSVRNIMPPSGDSKYIIQLLMLGKNIEPVSGDSESLVPALLSVNV